MEQKYKYGMEWNMGKGWLTAGSVALNMAQGWALSKAYVENGNLRATNNGLRAEAAELRRQLADQQRQTAGLRLELEVLRQKPEIKSAK